MPSASEALLTTTMPKSMPKKQRIMTDFARKETPVPAMRLSQNGGAGNEAPEAARAEGPEEPSLRAILMAVQESLAAVVGAVERLTSRFDGEATKVTALETRLQEAEERIGGLEDELRPLKQKAEARDKQLKELLGRIDEQEARSRRNNIRVVGLPESNMVGSMEAHIEKVLRAALPNAQLSQGFAVERAHRALLARPPPGGPPRAVIARILNYRDRDGILRAARVQGEATFEGAKLSFYPDFTQGIQKLRKTFWDVKQALRNRKVMYAMLYPAKLRVQHAGRTHFFTDPGVAADFVENHLPLPQQRHGNNGSSSSNNTPARSPRHSPAIMRVTADVHAEMSESQMSEVDALLDTND